MSIKFPSQGKSPLADILLSNPRGYREKAYDFHGKPLKILLMDPTIDDNQWWKAEMMKANTVEDRKVGRISIPAHVIPDIVVKAAYYPLDYGQTEEARQAGELPELAGQPLFSEVHKASIGNSTEKVFLKISDDWAARLMELYPFNDEEEAKN